MYSYSMITEIEFGKHSLAKRTVDCLIFLTSIFYLSSHIMVMNIAFGQSIYSVVVILIVCTLMSWIRKVHKFSFNYVISNIISFAIILVILYECIKSYITIESTNHFSTHGIYSFDFFYMIKTIGVSLASFEGIAFLLAIKNHSRDKAKFINIFTKAILF